MTRGAITSALATLTVLAPTRPSITTSPASQTVIAGESVTFAVAASGYAPLRYQWYFNTNMLLVNETNAALTIASPQTNHAGGYSVIITNSVTGAHHAWC